MVLVQVQWPWRTYEIALNIRNGDIVWANGPFPCGAYPDRKIAKEEGLENSLENGERYVADRGYHGCCAVTPDEGDYRLQQMMKLVRARHEMVNERFKQFGILSQVFRHKAHKHGIVSGAIANITRITICKESPLYQVNYIE